MNYISIILAIIIVILFSIYIRKLKKKINEFTYLLTIEDKNIDKNLTEEQIIHLHEEEKALKETLKDIENLINNDMPKWAKKTILFDKLKTEEELVCIDYNKYVETKKEYEELCGELDIRIPEEILKEIERYILPKYYVDNKKQEYSLSLTVISSVAAVLSIIPVFDEFSKYYILFVMCPIIGLLIVNAPKDSVKIKKYVFNIFFYPVMFFLIMFELHLGLVNYYNWWTDYDAEIAFVFVAIILALMLSWSIKKYVKSKRH